MYAGEVKWNEKRPFCEASSFLPVILWANYVNQVDGREKGVLDFHLLQAACDSCYRLCVCCSYFGRYSKGEVENMLCYWDLLMIEGIYVCGDTIDTKQNIFLSDVHLNLTLRD